MPQKTLVFVVMSYADKYYPIFTLIQAIALTRGVDAIRADEARSVIKKIRPGIFSKIRDADLIIAEISSGSANVLYEVGWAHAMGKPTLLLGEKDAEIPFDINDYAVVKYDPELPQSQLRRQIEAEFDKHLEAARRKVNLRQPLVEMLGSIEEIAAHEDLFTHLLGWSIERFVREAHQWTSDTIRVGAAEAIEKGIRIFQLLKQGGFATYMVPLNAYWMTDSKYLEECRVASAVRGAKIQRVFILPNHEALFSESLRDHVLRDEEAGVRTFVTFVEDIPEKDAVQDFGIWDEELFCLIEVGMRSGTVDTQVKGCLFTREKSALSGASLWRDSILSASQPAADTLKAIDTLDDSTKLLVRSADNMREFAAQYCRGSYLTRQNMDCGWYHRAWQYLRLLGLVSTPDWHADFYARSFREAFEAGARDVLISGTADYAILDHLVRALPDNILQKTFFTVLDACPTPLHVCRWYGKIYEEHSGVRLNVRYSQRDALDTAFHDQTFDLITSDAFLTRFPRNEQIGLVSEWHRILKPGGRVITTARLSRGNEIRKTVASEGEIEDFVMRAREEIEGKRYWLRPMAETVCGLARGYAQNIVSYTLPSEEYVRDLFPQFEISVESGHTVGEFEGTTEYARIVAIKK